MTTTALSKVRDNRSSYTWGEIRKFHEIGRYTIIEYKHRDENKTLFAVYVDGEDQSQSCETLDQAIIAAVASAHVSNSGAMALAACKILNLV